MPYVIKTGTIIIFPPGGDVPFTPLHTYFMAPSSCSDSNNGTSTATPWCTANPSGTTIVCGDVILAAPGSYSANFGLAFGTVSNCPSAGGINFAILLCAGADLEACNISSNQAGQTIFAPNNNWSIQGWKCNGVGSGTNRCFMAVSPNQTTIVHHHAFINNITVGSSQGFGGDDCPGGTCNHNVPGNGFDYWAVVGNIAWNSANAGICLGAIDAVGVANWDSNPGTHIYVYGNFAISNNSPSNGCSIDQEGTMFDTLDAHGYTNQAISANNIVYNSTRYGFQMFYQSWNTSTMTMKIYNNTFYNNLQQTDGDGADGELNWSQSTAGPGTPTPNWAFLVQRNIAFNPNATSPGGSTHNPVYAAVIGGTFWSGMVFGSTGDENILKGSATSCAGTCDSGPPYTISNFNGNGLGTNFIENPSFANTTDLFANRIGSPNCTGFKTTTACMGWNTAMGSLAVPSVISDLTANCAHCAGKGYQRPTTTCAANADYPTWLKGIVRLEASGYVDGATITEKADLVSKPCGM